MNTKNYRIKRSMIFLKFSKSDNQQPKSWLEQRLMEKDPKTANLNTYAVQVIIFRTRDPLQLCMSCHYACLYVSQ